MRSGGPARRKSETGQLAALDEPPSREQPVPFTCLCRERPTTAQLPEPGVISFFFHHLSVPSLAVTLKHLSPAFSSSRYSPALPQAYLDPHHGPLTTSISVSSPLQPLRHDPSRISGSGPVLSEIILDVLCPLWVYSPQPSLLFISDLLQWPFPSWWV